VRENATLSAGRELAKRHPPTSFDLTDATEQAEIVLYLEYGYIGLAELPKLMHRVRKMPLASHFLFSESDWPFPVLPGAFPSLYKPVPWACGWCYLPKVAAENEVPQIGSLAPRFLFSFLGRAWTHPLRMRLLSLDSETSPCLDVDDAPKRLRGFEYVNSYRQLIIGSKFVLCPRGFGASTIRIFEVMSLGRVPVIISDQWQPPPGIKWEEFCVFVAERDLVRIPHLLAQLEGDAARMGRCARDVFDANFSPEVFFERLLKLMMPRYSGCEFAMEDILVRAWRALGWREMRTIASQAKSFAVGSMRRLARS
jgi:glycosyltransferase involved in cell wall biosynthesis